MARVHLTDAEWAVIERLLPMDVRGMERVDDRRVLNGIVWRLRMGGRHPGAPWPAYDLWQPVPALAQVRPPESASGCRVKGLRR